jgi:hypothetical protein
LSSQVKGVYADRDLLSQQLSHDVNELLSSGDVTPFTVYSRLDAVQTSGNTSSHLRFLVYQLFFRRCCLKASSSLTRQAFVDRSRTYYASNTSTTTSIGRFDRDYNVSAKLFALLDNHSFVQRNLTQALLSLNMPMLFSLRFFVHDVLKAMSASKNGHALMRNGSTRFTSSRSNSMQTVYRTQLLSKDTVLKIKSSNGRTPSRLRSLVRSTGLVQANFSRSTTSCSPGAISLRRACSSTDVRREVNRCVASSWK